MPKVVYALVIFETSELYGIHWVSLAPTTAAAADSIEDIQHSLFNWISMQRNGFNPQ